MENRIGKNKVKRVEQFQKHGATILMVIACVLMDLSNIIKYTLIKILHQVFSAF